MPEWAFVLLSADIVITFLVVSNYPPGLSEYNELLRACAYAGDSKRSQKWLHEMSRTVADAPMLVAGAATLPAPDALSLRYALLAFTKSANSASSPAAGTAASTTGTAATGETALPGASSAAAVVGAVQLLEHYHPHIIKADAGCFNLIFLALSHLKLWLQTVDLGAIMLKDGHAVALDSLSIEFLLRAAGALARNKLTSERAVECANSVHAYMQQHKMSMNTNLFDLFLLIMSQAGHWKRVNVLWREFEETRLPYSRFTFEPLLRMLLQQRAFEDSWRVWGAAKALGFRLTAASYEAAIEAASGASKWQRVLALHKEMLEPPVGAGASSAAGYPERGNTLACVVRACAQLDRPDAALHAVAESRARGLPVVRESTLADLVELCARKGGPQCDLARRAAAVVSAAREARSLALSARADAAAGGKLNVATTDRASPKTLAAVASSSSLPQRSPSPSKETSSPSGSSGRSKRNSGGLASGAPPAHESSPSSSSSSSSSSPPSPAPRKGNAPHGNERHASRNETSAATSKTTSVSSPRGAVNATKSAASQLLQAARHTRRL